MVVRKSVEKVVKSIPTHLVSMPMYVSRAVPKSSTRVINWLTYSRKKPRWYWIGLPKQSS